MELKVNLNYKADKEYEAVNSSGNIVPIDMYASGEKKAQSPMELLLSSLAACAAVDIVAMIKKRRKTLVDLKAEVTGIRREETPKYFTDIHVKYIVYSPDAKPEEIEKLVSLAVEKYCSVASTVSGVAKIEHSVKLISD